MFGLSKYIGNEKVPSILKNPFKKVCVKRIYVSYQESWGGQRWTAIGSVEFQNGDTKGEQEFKAETFDEVVRKIKSFLEDLDKM